MSDFCSSDPTEPSVGACTVCGKTVCSRCAMREDDGLYCSLNCFTGVGTDPAEPPPAAGTGPAADPLSDIDFAEAAPAPLDPLEAILGKYETMPPEPAAAPPETPAPPSGPTAGDEAAAALDDQSVVLPAVTGDDSSSLFEQPELPKSEDDHSETSILEFRPVKNAAPATPDEPPMPVVIPGTTRATIKKNCSTHPDTPALVLCARCSTPICSLCIQDAAEGMICLNGCRAAVLRARQKYVILAAVAAAVLLVAFFVGALMKGSPAPIAPVARPPSAPVVHEPPKPELPKVEVPAPEPPVLVKAAPVKPEPVKPEPVKPEPVKPEPVKPEPVKPEPVKPEPAKPEPPKPEPAKPEPPKPEPAPAVKPRPHLAALADPWGKERAGAWYRTKTVAENKKDSYRDIGLRESGSGFRILISQSHEDGKSGAEMIFWTEPLELTVPGSLTGDATGEKYLADIVSWKSGASSMLVISEGPHAGASFPSGLTLTRLGSDVLRVNDREFSCTVLETVEKGSDRPTRTWVSPQAPLGAVRIEAPGSVAVLVDFGADWSRRPPFPEPPVVAKVEPPKPPPPPPPPPPVVDPIEKELRQAAELIRAATPIVEAVASLVDPLAPIGSNAEEILAKIDLAERNLSEARAVYVRILQQTADPAATDRRIEVLRDVLEALDASVGKIVTPRALLQAGLRIKEAAVICREMETAPREAVGGKSAEATAKLRAARELYQKIRKIVPNAAAVERRIRTLDELIESLEASAPR